MSHQPTNRLPSLWSSQSLDGEQSASPGFKRFAAKLEPAIKSMGAAIAAHPRTSLTVATLLGVATGWFIKRK